MILGLQLYGPLANLKGDDVEMFKAVKKLGICQVEPCVYFDGEPENPAFWSLEKFDKMMPILKEIGLDVISFHIITSDVYSKLPKLCEIAKKYGIKHFITGLPGYNELALQEAAFQYRRMADALAACGAEILIHNGKPDTEVKINGRTAYEYFIDICLDKVFMQFDTGWCAAGGVDPVDILKRNESRIHSLHFKDFDMNDMSKGDTIIGEGTLDNMLYMQFGRAKGIPLFIDQDTYTDVVTTVEKSYRYLMSAGEQRDHSVSYLNIYDTETKTVRTIKKFDGVIEAPNWVNSLHSLVYNADGAIYLFDLNTQESKRIDSGIANRCNNDHVISSDEKWIAVSSDFVTEEGGGSRIFILPLTGGEARLVTEHAPSYLHGWSPDGKELAYCAFRQVNGEMAVDVYAIPAEGGEEKRLTSAGFNDGPEYSPDGEHIWYISTRTGLMQVYRMNRDGSDSRQMTFEEQNNWFGHVSPDGKKVVNLSYRKGDLLSGEHLPNMQVDLWMMNYDGSEREKLFTFFGGQGSINVNSWSGDSRYFAFISYGIEV